MYNYRFLGVFESVGPSLRVPLGVRYSTPKCIVAISPLSYSITFEVSDTIAI